MAQYKSKGTEKTTDIRDTPIAEEITEKASHRSTKNDIDEDLELDRTLLNDEFDIEER